MNIKNKIFEFVVLTKFRQWLSTIKQNPVSYFSVALIFGLSGVAYLLLFPILAIVSLQALQAAALLPVSPDMLSACLFWMAIMVFAIAITHHILSIRLPSPNGIMLNPEQAPRLFSLLAAYTQSRWSPAVRRIMVSERFELDIIRLPGNAYPFWSKRTLVIGLPVLQSLSEAQFASVLQRKCLQYQIGSHLLMNCLHQLTVIWPQYAKAFRDRHRLGDQLLAGFFKYYAPAYRQFVSDAMQQRELHTDRLALAQVNDVDLFKAIQAEALSRYFFTTIYLPKIEQSISTGTIKPALVKPYAGFPVALRKVLTEQRVQNWLERLLRQSNGIASITPGLLQRMENIGHSRIRPPTVEGTATHLLLAPVYATLVQLLDKHWVTRAVHRAGNSSAHPQQTAQRPLQFRPST